MLTTVKLGRTKYTFEPKPPIMVLRGNSGTGKTLLMTLMANPNVQIDSEYEFIPVPVLPKGKTWDNVLQNYKGNIFLYADEDSAVIYNEEFQKSIVQNGIYLLVAARDPLVKIPYGIYDIYQVESINKVSFTLKPLFNKAMLPDRRKEYKTLVVEDSKSGFQFFKSRIKNTITAYGKSSILDLSRRMTSTVFLVDSLGFGSEIVRVLESLLINWTNTLFLIDSFEEMVLHSYLFKSTFVPDDKEFYKEDAYTLELKNFMNYLGRPYSKGRENTCLLRDCCQSPPKCEYFVRGDKFELILGDYLKEFLELHLEQIGTTDSKPSQEDITKENTLLETNLFG